MVELAANIWADGPSMYPVQPEKLLIRAWGTWVEGVITAFTSNGGLIYSSLALLNADLARPANTMAWVVGDPVATNNGVYGKVGASGVGSWTRRSDLPFSFIIASDGGAGTPNAIQATTSIPVSGSALIWMNIADTNGVGPTTVQFNGSGPVYTIKTNSGNDPSTGGLPSGMIVLGVISGTTFRLVSDQASAAIATAAEAAAVRAEMAAASIELPGIVNDTLLGTAGGVRINLTPAQARTLLSVERRRFRDFGAVGDGVTDDTAAVTAALASGLMLDGEGLIFKVSAVPSDFSKITRASFKVGLVIWPSRDFFRGIDTGKITSGGTYTAWAEDKCYVVGDRLHVWANEKESHTDGTARIVLFASDDGGASYDEGEYLKLEASGETLWCAGFDPSTNTEYLFVRVPAGSTDVAPYTYQMWKRTVTIGPGTANYYGAWTITNVTFPVPSGFSGQPIMVIGFSVGHGGSIVVGASYAAGAALQRSTDGGATYTAYVIATGTSYEEPSVIYEPTSQRYVGFLRNGGGGNPVYWYSGVNDLTTMSIWTAPAGTFGVNTMGYTHMPIVAYNGRFYSHGGYRSGTFEGAASDELTSFYRLDFPVFFGNIWANANLRIMRLGTIPHREVGGASALAVGGAFVHEDKLHLIYGMEERTGDTATLNRVMNLYQTMMPLVDRGELFDFRSQIASNRHSGKMKTAFGGKAYTIYQNDTHLALPAIISGRLNDCEYPTTLVLVSDVLTLPTTGRYGAYIVDTEAAAASDNIASIVDVNAKNGDRITVRQAASSRDLVVKNGVGNIYCGADFTLSFAYDEIEFRYVQASGLWVRKNSDNA